MKRQQQTAIAVFRHDIEPTLQHREQIVLDALRGWRGDSPTSYELTEYLMARGQAFDLNSTRPRLTSLFEKHLVEHGEKRPCHITGKRCLTWRLAAPRIAREPEAQDLFT